MSGARKEPVSQTGNENRGTGLGPRAWLLRVQEPDIPKGH